MKIERNTFLYLHPQGDKKRFAQCETCIVWLGDKKRCAWHGKKEVSADASCGFYVHGIAPAWLKPILYRLSEWVTFLKPEWSGLVKREVRCENCTFFDDKDEPREHCDLFTQLNRMFPRIFELDRYVDRHGCCNAQTPGMRDPGHFGPHGPLGESGEAIKHALRVASAARKKTM